jgi:hypothetical protein
MQKKIEVTQQIINKLVENSILESSPDVTHDGAVRQNDRCFRYVPLSSVFVIFWELHIFP